MNSLVGIISISKVGLVTREMPSRAGKNSTICWWSKQIIQGDGEVVEVWSINSSCLSEWREKSDVFILQMQVERLLLVLSLSSGAASRAESILHPPA